jgi:hypothetical protein
MGVSEREGWKIECARATRHPIVASSAASFVTRRTVLARPGPRTLIGSGQSALVVLALHEAPDLGDPRSDGLGHFENDRWQKRGEQGVAARSGRRRRCRGRRECAPDACWLGGLRRARSVVQRGILFSSRGASCSSPSRLRLSVLLPTEHGPGPKGARTAPRGTELGERELCGLVRTLGCAASLHSSSGPVRRWGRGGSPLPPPPRSGPVSSSCSPLLLRDFLGSS